MCGVRLMAIIDVAFIICQELKLRYYICNFFSSSSYVLEDKHSFFILIYFLLFEIKICYCSDKRKETSFFLSQNPNPLSVSRELAMRYVSVQDHWKSELLDMNILTQKKRERGSSIAQVGLKLPT